MEGPLPPVVDQTIHGFNVSYRLPPEIRGRIMGHTLRGHAWDFVMVRLQAEADVGFVRIGEELHSSSLRRATYDQIDCGATGVGFFQFDIGLSQILLDVDVEVSAVVAPVLAVMATSSWFVSDDDWYDLYDDFIDGLDQQTMSNTASNVDDEIYLADVDGSQALMLQSWTHARGSYGAMMRTLHPLRDPNISSEVFAKLLEEL